jgi:hypothetical protein
MADVWLKRDKVIGTNRRHSTADMPSQGPDATVFFITWLL